MKLSASLSNKSGSKANPAAARAKAQLATAQAKHKTSLARAKESGRMKLVRAGLISVASLATVSAGIGYLQGPSKITFAGIDGRLIVGGLATAYGAYRLYKGKKHGDTALAVGLGVLGSLAVDYAAGVGSNWAVRGTVPQGRLPQAAPAYAGAGNARRVVVQAS